MSKKMILKGVGRFMARKTVNGVPTNEVLDCGSLQALRFDLNVELEDIFGGDGMFAIDQLLKSKAITVTATEAKFDLNMVALLMGGAVKEDQVTTLWVLGEQKVAAAGAVTLDCDVADFSDAGITVKIKDENVILTKVTGVAEPTATEYKVDTTGPKVKLTLDDSHDGKTFVISYEKDAETVDVYDIMAEEVPFPVSVVHQGTFVQKDGTKQGVQTELYSCIANGTFSMDMQRRSASSHEVSLRVIDPERADGKLGDIKRFAVA